MSKIIFTQEFDSYEEGSEFKTVTQSREMSIALTDILELLRKYDKYGHAFKSIEEAIEKIREEVYEIVNSYHIDLGN